MLVSKRTNVYNTHLEEFEMAGGWRGWGTDKQIHDAVLSVLREVSM